MGETGLEELLRQAREEGIDFNDYYALGSFAARRGKSIHQLILFGQRAGLRHASHFGALARGAGIAETDELVNYVRSCSAVRGGAKGYGYFSRGYGLYGAKPLGDFAKALHLDSDPVQLKTFIEHTGVDPADWNAYAQLAVYILSNEPYKLGQFAELVGLSEKALRYEHCPEAVLIDPRFGKGRKAGQKK